MKALGCFLKKRWGNSPICPSCNAAHRASKLEKRSGLYRCKSCRLIYTVRTGTVFHRSHVELHKWLYAIYLTQTARKGISSLQLAKQIGVTSKRLGVGQGMGGKEAVMGFRKRGGKTKVKRLKSTDQKTMQRMVQNNIEAGSTICTDDHRGYARLSNLPYKHKTVSHTAKEYIDSMAHTNGIESVWAVLKRGHYGTFHHFSAKHLERYANEFSFRLNEGNCQTDTIDRITSLLQGAAGKRLTHKRPTA